MPAAYGAIPRAVGRKWPVWRAPPPCGSSTTPATLGGGMNTLMAAHFSAPDADKRNWSVRGLEERMAHTLGYVADTLGERPYLAGDTFSLADIAVSTALGIWRGALNGTIPDRLVAYRERLAERPAYQRAQARAAGG